MGIVRFFRNNVVMTIAFVAAFITCFFVPIDNAYLSYFDLKTLTCLFCTLAVVCALKNIHFFQTVARKIVSACKNLQGAVLALVYITFLGSMLIANDMALLTFLPLGYFVLYSTGNQKKLAFTFIMQTIAANLGGMITPFGNPQNLYLYSYFNIPDREFFSIMFLPFVVSMVLITLCCLVFVKKEPLTISENDLGPLDRKKTCIYLCLFCYSILIVFRTIPYWTGLVLIPFSLFILDRKALKMVDYPLLLTFCAFFVFSGNLARIPAVQNLFGALVEKYTLYFSVFSCQIISNVPTAILLSKFTTNYPALLVAVNIGGAGTLLASLASLITFKEYLNHQPNQVKSYLFSYSAYNFTILFILLIIMTFVLQ